MLGRLGVTPSSSPSPGSPSRRTVLSSASSTSPPRLWRRTSSRRCRRPATRMHKRARSRPAHVDTVSGTGSMGMHDSPEAGRTLYPLFFVRVHEYMWVAAGYGVCSMAMYLERFWT
ncbi:hypothetical protein V8E53_002191 [Lactarius tabidus]